MVCLTAFFLLIMHNSIMQMIVGFLLTNFIVWVVTLFLVKHCVGISCFMQIRQMLPSLLISVAMCAIVMLFDAFVPMSPLGKLCCELLIGVVSYTLFAWIFKFAIFKDIVNQIVNKFIHK